MTRVELLKKLVPLIPPTYANLTRFRGVFAPTSRLRATIVPSRSLCAQSQWRRPPSVAPSTIPSKPSPPRSTYRLDWRPCSSAYSPSTSRSAPADVDVNAQAFSYRGHDLCRNLGFDGAHAPGTAAAPPRHRHGDGPPVESCALTRGPVAPWRHGATWPRTGGHSPDARPDPPGRALVHHRYFF